MCKDSGDEWLDIAGMMAGEERVMSKLMPPGLVGPMEG